MFVGGGGLTLGWHSMAILSTKAHLVSWSSIVYEATKPGWHTVVLLFCIVLILSFETFFAYKLVMCHCPELLHAPVARIITQCRISGGMTRYKDAVCRVGHGKTPLASTTNVDYRVFAADIDIVPQSGLSREIRVRSESVWAPPRW